MGLRDDGWRPFMYRRGNAPSLASSLSLVSAVRQAQADYVAGVPQQLGDVLEELASFADLADLEIAAFAAAVVAKVESEWILPMRDREDNRGVLG